jgi:hypothetical protein
MDGHDQQYQVPLSVEAIGSNDFLGLQERRKGRVLTRTIAQAVLEVPVMTAIVDAEAAEEAGKYCKLVAVDFEFDAGRNVGLGMTAATVRGMTDTRNSVGSVQGREVVHVLAAGSGIDCCRTDSSVQYFEALARALSYTGQWIRLKVKYQSASPPCCCPRRSLRLSPSNSFLNLFKNDILSMFLSLK